MDTNVWQEFQANRDHEITRAFRELQERWEGIFAQEQVRVNAAVNYSRYAMNQEGHWTHAWVSKPDAQRVAGMEQAVRDMRETNDTRLPYEAFSGYGSYMSGPHPALRGWARDEHFRKELAVSAPEHLQDLLQKVETMQQEYTAKDSHWWDLQQGAKMIREELGQRGQEAERPLFDQDGEWTPAQRQQYREAWSREQQHYRAQELPQEGSLAERTARLAEQLDHAEYSQTPTHTQGQRY